MTVSQYILEQLPNTSPAKLIGLLIFLILLTINLGVVVEVGVAAL